MVYTLSLAKGSQARPVLSASGNPERIARCDWVSNQRLVCEVYGFTKQNPALQPLTFSRLLAVDADGLHIGQDDLPLETARKLMGPDKLIDATSKANSGANKDNIVSWK